MKILNDFFRIFYPELCVNCENQLINNETILCTFCRHDLPFTNITNYQDNKVTQVFYGRTEVEKAFSLLLFRKKGITKKLIHELKYKGNEDIGVFFGNWIGDILKENKEFIDIDCIIPVPLHVKKLKQRGYNQVTKFGEQLSLHMQKPLLEHELVRVSSTKTQTYKSRFERFKNTNTKFEVKNPSIFKNKHVLLIDDVITTGATLEACIEEIKKENKVKVSILTMAYTE
ncbi:ComF family protein [Polaribacter septentrionalilitoris]|uniref:ComF family protein n=1 Tax=Polaribacter septentrionalilitoris TaxID=2494657 RepID=UPI00135781E1|nr:phosphoribosyltransferase family protein [Polaribacter septentrionalilitoris]